MEEINIIKRLVSTMHCSHCKKEYVGDFIKPIRLENGLIIFQIKCENCERCFALGLFGLSKKDFFASFELPKSSKNGAPISYDDVLDAHKFFQNMDENWAKFIEEKNCEI